MIFCIGYIGYLRIHMENYEYCFQLCTAVAVSPSLVSNDLYRSIYPPAVLLLPLLRLCLQRVGQPLFFSGGTHFSGTLLGHLISFIPFKCPNHASCFFLISSTVFRSILISFLVSSLLTLQALSPTSP